MKIPLHIAEKLLLLSNGETIAASKLRHSIIDELVAEGIANRSGRVQKTVRVYDTRLLHIFLKTRYQVNDLAEYIGVLKAEEIKRADLVEVATNSKIKSVRTFRGFLVNSYMPVNVTLKGQSMVVFPGQGTFQFIYDFNEFVPDPDVVIVGIENPENFRYIAEQKSLFGGMTPLFVSRYPQSQSKDLIFWLKSIPNKYYHFGDFDLAGLGIYLNEFKKHLNTKATFFIPSRLEDYLIRYGSRDRFDYQRLNFNADDFSEENVKKVYELILKHKKGLDQEIFLKDVVFLD